MSAAKRIYAGSVDIFQAEDGAILFPPGPINVDPFEARKIARAIFSACRERGPTECGEHGEKK